MRPHRLTVTAFGPFPGTVEVDLDRVSEAGPFLLRGATGAGKTSLLDAIGYALFGKVPGARGMKQLRSDHAPAGVRTSVELWATVAGRAVHVVRTPDQPRPRSRGGGTTTDKATVVVRVARDLAALADDDCDRTFSGVQEANAELADLVGMTHEQFVQVVLLPQGDFARFLRAKDDERADVLRALFDAGRFTAVEHHLKSRRDASRDALSAATTSVRTRAARVAEQAGVDDVPEGDGLSAWARTLLDDAATAASSARTQAGHLDEGLRSVRVERDRAGTHARLLQELGAAAARRRDLVAEAPAMAERQAHLLAADRAAEVVAFQRTRQQARDRADTARADALHALSAAVDDLHPTGAPGAEVLTTPPADTALVAALSVDLDARSTAALEVVTRLEALVTDVDRWHDVQADLVAGREQVAAAGATATATRARLHELPGRVDALAARLHALQADAAGLDAATREVTRWQALLAQQTDLCDLVGQADRAERDHLASRGAARAADDRLDALRRARLDGMADELASSLVPGEPCCVCGSTEHPEPASGDGSAVDARTEEQARDEAGLLAAEVARLGVELARVQTRRDGLHAGLLRDAAPQLAVPPLAELDADGYTQLHHDLTDRLAVARSQQGAAEAAALKATETASHLDEIRAEQAVLSDRLTADETAHAVAVRTHEGLVEESSRRRADLVRALGDRAALEPPRVVWTQVTQSARDALHGVRAAAAAVGHLSAALGEADRAEQLAAQACRAAGWDDADAATAAARSRAWREESRQVVATHSHDLHAVTLRLEELAGHTELSDLAVLSPDAASLVRDADELLEAARAHEAELATAVDVAEADAREANEQRVRAQGVLAGLQRTVPLLVDADRETGPLRVRAEACKSLADLCAGSNDKGIPLSTYVLAAHLEHVVEAANQRLHGMSEGRYALVHVEESGDRRRKAGLGLAVLDAWTGVQRPAGTLSGGETFLASLALALGLADVVTAEAGGVRIDALFVDEGFGTLDPDSLDRAMDVLDQLQEHGRMVGVVSHVGELRQRLPRQVHVEAGRGGSTVRVLCG